MTQPTHNEVIAWIDREVIEAGWSADSPVDSYFFHHQSDIDEANRYRASLLANRAVLERHKPQPLMGGSLLPEFQCADGCGNFPCYSYTDVTDQLDLVMGASND